MTDPENDPVALQDTLAAQLSPPPLDPQTLGVTRPQPVPPQVPTVPPIDQNKRRMQALVALAAGLAGGPNAMQGIGRGVQTNWQMEERTQEHQLALANNQYGHQLQKYAIDTHAFEQEAAQRQQLLTQTVKSLQLGIAKGQIKTQQDYDAAIGASFAGLQSQGVRVTKPQLIAWATFTPPSDNPAISDAIVALNNTAKDRGGLAALLQANPTVVVNYTKVGDGTPAHMPLMQALQRGLGAKAGVIMTEDGRVIDLPKDAKETNPSAARTREEGIARVTDELLAARNLTDLSTLDKPQRNALRDLAETTYDERQAALKTKWEIQRQKDEIAAGVKLPPQREAKPENPAVTRSYEYNSKELQKLADPIAKEAQNLAGVRTLLNERNQQSDALVAPKLLSAVIGTGAGLRMTEPEINRVVGGATVWTQLQAKLNALSTNPKEPRIPEVQRAQMLKLIDTLNAKATAKLARVRQANQDLIDAGDITRHRQILADLQNEMDTVTQGGGAEPATPGGPTRESVLKKMGR